MIIQMNEFHVIDIRDNALKLTFNKSHDFDIIDLGQYAFFNVGVGS
jgi:hypothetical protein